MANDVMYKSLAVGRPTVLSVPNQVVSFNGMAGLCDPLLQSSINAFTPFCYDTVIHQWSLANDGGDLTLAKGQEATAFTEGVGESQNNGWWTKTASDTDLIKGGAPIDISLMYIVVGFGIAPLDPYQRGGSGASADDPKKFTAWMAESEDGPGYSFLIEKAELNYSYIIASFGDTGQTYRMGLAAHYPDATGPAGAQTVRNGVTGVPGLFMPFTTAMAIGGRDEIRQLKLSFFTGQACVVQNNNANPTISGSTSQTNGTINTANVGTVYAPMRVTAYGYIVCVPDAQVCGIMSMSDADFAALKSRYGFAVAGQ